MREFTGELEATFGLAGAGTTKLRHSYHRAPLKIAKTFPYPGGQAGVCMMDCSPGMLAGDRYRIELAVEEGASAFVTNQSYTKVHPSRERPCLQRQTLTVGRSAILEYRPEPVMLYKDGCFAAHTDVALAEGAVLLLSDVVAPGRVLRGETFRYARYESGIDVRYGDELIYCNRQRIEPESLAGSGFGKPGVWGSYTHQGAMYAFGDRVRPEYVVRLRETLDAWLADCATQSFVPAHETSLDAHGATAPRLAYGASLTYKHGLALFVLGLSAWEIQRLIAVAWNFVKQLMLMESGPR